MHGEPATAPGSKGDSMASFRTITALSAIAGAAVLAAMSTATAQTALPIESAAAPVAVNFNRCPKTSDQYAEVIKQLTSTAARARALADEDPMLEPDAAFYAAELAATKKCAPTLATLQR